MTKEQKQPVAVNIDVYDVKGWHEGCTGRYFRLVHGNLYCLHCAKLMTLACFEGEIDDDRLRGEPRE